MLPNDSPSSYHHNAIDIVVDLQADPIKRPIPPKILEFLKA